MSKYTVEHETQKNHCWLWHVKEDGKIIATILSDRKKAFYIRDRLECIESMGEEYAHILKNNLPKGRLGTKELMGDTFSEITEVSM